jgi:hypothetical protein
VSKFTDGERSLVKSIVANLTIKRVEEEDIIKVIQTQTNKTITRKEIWNIRERIKRESYRARIETQEFSKAIAIFVKRNYQKKRIIFNIGSMF